MNNFDEEQKKLTSRVKEAADEAKRAAKHLKDAKKDVQTAKEEKETIGVEKEQLLKEKTRLDFIIKDLNDEVLGDNKSKVWCIILHSSFFYWHIGVMLITSFCLQDRAEQELKKLQETIRSKEKELEELKPKYEAQKKKEEECTRE